MLIQKLDNPSTNIVTLTHDEIDLINFDLCKEPKETLGSYYNRMDSKPAVLINGGFFNMSTGETCFSFVNDDDIIKEHYGVKEGLGTTFNDPSKLLFGSVDDGTDWYDFIAGYPVIVKDGKAVTKFTWASEINYDATRSAIGYTKNNDIVVVTVNKPGVTLDKLGEIMANQGCVYAINLDGGGSSRLMVNGEVINTPTENRSVDSVIAIYLKNTIEETPYIYYTVKKGDSLWAIATNYLGDGTRYKEIVELNKLMNTMLYVGQQLKVPVDYTEYTVQSGDTLWGIAVKETGSGTKYKEIMEFNELTSTVLHVGQVLKIPL